jgi:dolichol-phosphate mannosyltransferase
MRESAQSRLDFASIMSIALHAPRPAAASAVCFSPIPVPVFGLPKTALIIPTLREAANIPILLERIQTALDPTGLDYEILIVDDDSRDGIEEAVAGISQADPRVQLLVRKGKRGLSGAVLHGWMHTEAAIVGVMDADLQHPPELLPELITKMLDGCDLVIGSRYTEGGGLGSWDPLRKLFSAAAVWVTWPVQRSGVRAKDPMSGFFFVRRRCLSGIAFQEAGFKLLLEVLVRARIASVREVPFAFGRRFCGASKANLKVALEYGKLLARLYRYRFGWKRHVPVSLFE